jgi:hypothetical protein
MDNRNLQKYRPSEQGVLVYTCFDVCQMLDWTCKHQTQQHHHRSSVDGLGKLWLTTQS